MRRHTEVHQFTVYLYIYVFLYMLTHVYINEHTYTCIHMDACLCTYPCAGAEYADGDMFEAQCMEGERLPNSAACERIPMNSPGMPSSMQQDVLQRHPTVQAVQADSNISVGKAAAESRHSNSVANVSSRNRATSTDHGRAANCTLPVEIFSPTFPNTVFNACKTRPDALDTYADEHVGDGGDGRGVPLLVDVAANQLEKRARCEDKVGDGYNNSLVVDSLIDEDVVSEMTGLDSLWHDSSHVSEHDPRVINHGYAGDTGTQKPKHASQASPHGFSEDARTPEYEAKALEDSAHVRSLPVRREKDIQQCVSMSLSTAGKVVAQEPKKPAESKVKPKTATDHASKKTAKDKNNKAGDSGKALAGDSDKAPVCDNITIAAAYSGAAFSDPNVFAPVITSPGALLLDIADRVPYIAVKQKEAKVWNEFRVACERSKDDMQMVFMPGQPES